MIEDVGVLSLVSKNRKLGILDDHQYKVAVKVDAVWCFEVFHHGTSIGRAFLFVLRCFHSMVCLNADEAVDDGLALCVDIGNDVLERGHLVS